MKMKWWKWLLIATATVTVAVIGVCAWTLVGVMEVEDLRVTGEELIEESGMPVVAGTAMNAAGEELHSVEAEVTWYGPGDVVLGRTYDFYLINLRPVEFWHFEVKGWGVSFEEVTRYELRVWGTTL